MASVKLHIPYYDDNILRRVINLNNNNNNIKILFIDGIKNVNKDRKFKYICEKIFDNYGTNLIIIGDFLMLPIPKRSRYIIKGIKGKNKQKYTQSGYQQITHKKLMKSIKKLICDSWSIHTAKIRHPITNKYIEIDVYKLWYITYNKKHNLMNKFKFIKSFYKLENIKDYETLELWNDETIKSKNQRDKIKKANVKYPVITYKKKVLDGNHRVAKSYLSKNIKNIKFIKLTLKEVENCVIKDIDETINTIKKGCHV